MPKQKTHHKGVATGAIFATLCAATILAPNTALAEDANNAVAAPAAPQFVETPAPSVAPAETPAPEPAPAETPASEPAPAEPASEPAPAEAPTPDPVPEPSSDPAPIADQQNDAPQGEASGSEANNPNPQTVTYDYNAGLYSPTGNEADAYAGVYATTLAKNNATAENPQTIGMPSIADKNLANAPTTESPAIIQGAAVGYEIKTGPTSYTILKERDEPYSDFRYTILNEQGADGTTHTKLSGFDGTYVIVRLNVDELFKGHENGYLHMRQDDNRAMLVAVGMLDKNHAFCSTLTTASGDYKAGGIYKTGSYTRQDLLDMAGADRNSPYIDVVVFATASNVAGADAGKADAMNGDIPLHFYVDDTFDYNPSLVYDPQSTDPNHVAQCLAKFYDAAKTTIEQISNYVIKGSDLALETMVEDSGGPNKDIGTTYWSLAKSLENPYYDQEIDRSPTDPGCGRTVKLMSEVAVIDGIQLSGTDANNPKKRTLDVNSFDIQIAKNTASDNTGFTLDNAWLTIADKSNTTGAEFAIGNNARMQINSGGKLIIDETCQLEIEWDGATTQPGQAMPADTLNNGMLDLRAGGEIVNNGVITIEGTEGKPYQPDTQQQASSSQKGFGEFTIRQGATLTNNGCLLIYGRLYNMGTIVNNGKYNENPIVSNDPDKGTFAYHRGIQVSWKDDVTQQNVTMGELRNGMDREGNTLLEALLHNLGDIVLVPGKLLNWGTIINEDGANIYVCAATEAIIPIEPTQQAPTISSKRIKLNPPVASLIENWGTIINRGRILPASVELLDNTGFGKLTEFGDHPELFRLINHGTIINDGYIYGWDKGSSETATTPVAARIRPLLPATGDAASVAAMAMLTVTGAASVLVGRSRRK